MGHVAGQPAAPEMDLSIHDAHQAMRVSCVGPCRTPGGGEPMISRRAFLSLLAGSMSAPRVAFAQSETRKVALYANVGADLTHYDVDVAGAALTRRATVTLPAGVQYAWPHASRR